MSKPDRISVFLSHSSKDKRFAKRLGTDLGLWRPDMVKIQVGDELTPGIARGIKTAKYFAIIFSPDCVESEWVAREIEVADEHNADGGEIVFLPLLYRDCSMAARFKDKCYADFRNERGFLESLNKVVASRNPP